MEQSTPGENGLEPRLPPHMPDMATDTDTDTTADASLSQGTRHMSLNGTHATSSAPPTPSLPSPSLPRRTSHSASPNLAATTPSVPPPSRRASSSASSSRPPPSPRLQKKPSRSSMGGSRTPDDSEGKPTPKRSISNLISGLRAAQSSMEAIEEPEPLTAPQLATAHFARELQRHTDAGSEAETVVILHDACYGHRWSRLKTTKTQLSLIVERPERIQASVLGASSAYVRLGGHHTGANNAPHPHRNSASQPPFKIRRTDRALSITSPYVTNVHGTSWMNELSGMCHTAAAKLAAGARELSRAEVHGQPEKERLHEGDLYLAPGSLDAFQGALGGVADAIDEVFSKASATKRAFVAVRPPGHHCSAEHPSGFCWLNNVHVGIEYATQTYGLTHAAMLDFDLHHGDGSQAITWERNSRNNEKRVNAKPNSKLKLTPDIGYYSLHDINSYPCEMGDDEKVQAASLCIENAHSQSIWNVHLQPWKTEAEFWRLYEDKYRILIDKARIFLQYHSDRLRSEGKVKPRAAIFISAGFDASEWEGAGMQRHKVSVPTEFYARFTQDIVRLSQEVDGCEGRVISVLEGGYSDRALCSGVLSHLSGLCASPVTTSTSGVEGLMDLSHQMNGLSIAGLSNAFQYDTDWWSSANLTALEHKINPPPPPQAKKMRTGPQPTYATPTESFAYKVVDANKFARSISGTLRDVGRPNSAAPEQPPPEVDWVIATQELSKLLIPVDRQINSCTSEELAAPRLKKEPQSTFSTLEAAKPRQLRDRTTKAPTYAKSADDDESASVAAVSRAESRSSRRETIDVLPTPVQERRASRRVSMGSELGTVNGTVDDNAPPVPAVPSQAAFGSTGSMKPPPVPPFGAQPGLKQMREAPKSRKATVPTKVPSSPASKAAQTAATKPPAVKSTTGEQKADVDSLATGLKKITLKVPATKEEHDRKQKEKVDFERRARALKGAETRRINAAARKAAQAGSVAAPAKSTLPTAVKVAPGQGTAAPPQASASVEDDQQAYRGPSDTLINQVEAAKENVETEIDVNFNASQGSFRVVSAASDPQPTSSDQNNAPSAASASERTVAQPWSSDAFPQPDAEGDNIFVRPSAPIPFEMSQHINLAESLPAQAPLTEDFTGAAAPSGTTPAKVNNPSPSSVLVPTRPPGLFPSPIRPASRGELPVFSSTGPIPFAAASPASRIQVKQQERSIGDVPDTPAK